MGQRSQWPDPAGAQGQTPESQSVHCWVFDAFRLDRRDERLWRGREVLSLSPKPFAVLCCLVTQAGQLVTKTALLEAVWPETAVSEAVLQVAIREVRQVLGDQARTPRFIETAHGRGYRFIAPVSAPTSPGGPVVMEALRRSPPPRFSRPRHFVGRDAELAQVMQWWTTARQGTRQVGIIAGEPGIGKTTLGDTFVAQVAATEDIWVGHGQCIDHYGEGEAYLPVLEALGRLCRDPEGVALLPVLRQYAPSWLVHLPALLAAGDRERLAYTASGVTPARMLRELAEALEVLTATRPLVLVLEDLHWSDRATLEWVAYVVRRRDPARLLILGTYRPVDVIVHTHPLRPLLAELRQHPQCAELVLDYLPETAVAAYLQQRCGATPVPTDLPQILHQRTSGNPLFLVTLVDELMRQRLLEARGNAPGVQGGLEVVTEVIPTSLRQFIEAHVERLPSADQALLEAASVAGPTFAVAAVAAGVSLSEEAIEAGCGAWARHGQFLHATGTETWPDGTVTACYQFIHALYHEVVYARVSAGQRIRLHHQIGTRKETGYGDQAPSIAAELAVHFERGHEYARAVHYLTEAGKQALRRSAHHEAISHLTTGRELLKTLADTPERAQRELSLQITLGTTLLATKGLAAPEAEQAYARARELCQQVNEPRQLCAVLWGLRTYYNGRAEFHLAREVAEQLLALAQRLAEPALLVEAHRALGNTLYFQGEVAAAYEHFAQGSALYDMRRHRSLALLYENDPGVGCLCFAAVALWNLGYPDRARHSMQAALQLAQDVAHLSSQAMALALSAALHQNLREAHTTRERAETLLALARTHGFAGWFANGTIYRGWALAQQGQADAGLQEIRQGLTTLRTAGIALNRSRFLMALADVGAQAGQPAEGLSALTESFALMQSTGGRLYQAELYRLYGELALRIGAAETGGSGDNPILSDAPFPRFPVSSPEAAFQTAMVIAQRQQEKSLELRAATSLSRLWQQQGQQAAAYDLLAPIYGWFTEGFDTADLQEAKALLEELGG